MERTLERADRAGDRAHHVGARAGDHAAGEGRGVHAVVDHRDPVGVERARRRWDRARGRAPCRGSSRRATGPRAARSAPARLRGARARRRSSGSARSASSRLRGRRPARCRPGRDRSSDSVAQAMRSASIGGALAAARTTRQRLLGQRAQPGHLAPQLAELVALGQRAAPQQVRGLLEARPCRPAPSARNRR